MTTPRARTARADIARGLGAAAALLGFVVGVPLALIALAPVYLLQSVPSWAQLRDQVMSPDDGSLLLAVLGAIAWITWAVFTASVLVELAASARRVHAPGLPMLGGVQRTAARLVATAGLLLASTTAITTQASPATASALVATAASGARTEPTAPDAVNAPTLTGAPTVVATTALSPVPPSALPSVTVRRGDTLWDLAERHLGDPLRYTEIRDLNTGRAQADGERLHDADFIRPGWTLLLPADAREVPLAVPTHSTPPGESTVLVQPGDTLWSIAAKHLGDGHRYTDIADLNRGIAQSDGGHLSDPNILRPGWVLHLPSTTPTPPQGAPLLAESSPRGDAPGAPGSSPASVPSPAPTITEPSSPRGSLGDGRTFESPAQKSTATNDEDAQQPIAPWFLGLTALAAAGLVGEITRRRHLQQRARRMGESIPMPEPTSPAAAAERTLRTAPTPVSIEAIRTTLHNLACRCFHDGRDLPRVAALLLDEQRLTLLLTEDAEALHPFTASDPRTWVATTADIAAEEPIDDPGQGTPYPLLVTLGHTDGATLILNLEAAGTLAFVGESTAAEDALRALVMEAATSKLAGQLPIHTDGTFANLTEAFEEFRLRGTEPRDNRIHWAKSVSEALGRHGLSDVLQARGSRELDDVWLPIVFVERDLTSSASGPWSGVVTLTRQEVEDAWLIRVDGDGDAHLSPLDVTFRSQRLTSAQEEELRSILVASVPPQAQTGGLTRTISTGEDLAALRAAHPIAEEPRTAPTRIELKVLGPIQVAGVPGRPLTPRTVELLVYLALHGPASGPDLDEMIWNGERGNPNTRNVFIRRVRERLGDEVLPPVGPDGLFRLGEGIDTDWACFQRHLANALVAEGQEQLDELAAGLTLVRDRPFRGIGPSAYVWADHDIQVMVAAVADVATMLARMHDEAGRHRDAITVASLGLMAEPCSEDLQTIAITATSAQAGPEEAKNLRHRYSAAMAKLDPELAS